MRSSSMTAEISIPTVANLPLELPLFCDANDSVRNVAALMSARRRYCVLVQSEGKLSGIVTTKDLAFKEGRTAREVLSPTPVLTPSSMPVSDALQIMVERKIRHLPIVDQKSDDMIVGILDITKCFHQAMTKLEIMAHDSAKLNNAIQDVIENEATMVRQKLLQDIAGLIDLMETPILESILDSELYNTTPLFASPTTTVSEAMKLMAEKQTTAILIHDSSVNSDIKNSFDCNIIGIFTSKDFVCRVLNQTDVIDPKTCTLARAMTTRPNFAFRSLGIHSALRMMYEGHFLNLPVIDDAGNILGLISVLQLTHAALSCQLATTSRSHGNIHEPYIKVNRLKSKSTSNDDLKAIAETGTAPSPDVDAPDIPINYFWKSFDISDNESASSSQLSLVDLTGSVSVPNVSNPNKPQEQFSGRRSSTLLQKKFFENVIHNKCRFRITVKKQNAEDVLGFLKYKTMSFNTPEKDILTEIIDKVKCTYSIDSSFELKYLDTTIMSNEALLKSYSEFRSTNGSRQYMPLLFLWNPKSSTPFISTIKKFLQSVSTLYQSSVLKTYMQACMLLMAGFLIGKTMK